MLFDFVHVRLLGSASIAIPRAQDLRCSAHAGGYLPSYAARSDQGCVTFPARCTKTLKKKPTEYLKQLYYDSLVFTAEGLRHLIAEVGAGQIVMGTDYPFPWTKTAVDHILTTPGVERCRARRDTRGDGGQPPRHQAGVNNATPSQGSISAGEYSQPADRVTDEVPPAP